MKDFFSFILGLNGAVALSALLIVLVVWEFLDRGHEAGVENARDLGDREDPYGRILEPRRAYIDSGGF